MRYVATQTRAELPALHSTGRPHNAVRWTGLDLPAGRPDLLPAAPAPRHRCVWAPECWTRSVSTTVFLCIHNDYGTRFGASCVVCGTNRLPNCGIIIRFIYVYMCVYIEGKEIPLQARCGPYIYIYIYIKVKWSRYRPGVGHIYIKVKWSRYRPGVAIYIYIHIYIYIKIKWCRYRPGVGHIYIKVKWSRYRPGVAIYICIYI